MPEISLFYGIRVTMYYDDHNPPHFHAEYNGNKAIVEIDGVRVIKGALPSKQLKLILAWCVLHQDELMQNWELSNDGNWYYMNEASSMVTDPITPDGYYVDANGVWNGTEAQV